MTLALLGAAGCGGQDVGEVPRIARLMDHLRFDQQEPAAAQVLARWMVQDDTSESPFGAEGHERSMVAAVPIDTSADIPETRNAFVVFGDAGRCAVARPEAPLIGVDLVDLEVTFHGLPGINQMVFEIALMGADGRELHRTDSQSINTRRVAQLMIFTVPSVGTEDEPVTSIRFISMTGGAPFAILSLTAHKTPLARLLPLPGNPTPWTIGRGTRQAIGVTGSTPLSGELVVPRNANLDLSYAWPQGLVLEDAPPVLEVFILGKNGEMTVTLPVPPEGWSDERIPMKQFSGQRVRIEVKVDGGAALIGDGTIAGLVNDPPTVLLVTSDTHRGDHLGYANPPFALATPVIDRLAAEGASFVDCTATTNITNPSHVAIMTGIHPRDAGVVDNFTPINTSAETLAEHFQGLGYRTLAVLSTQHLGPQQSGLGQGFDRVDTPLIPKRDGSETVDQTLAWLEEADGVPVFVWVHLFDAHAPYDVPTGLLELHRDGPQRDSRALADVLDQVPSWILDHKLTSMDDPERLYRIEVESVDAQLGRLMALPRVEQGWIAFTGDHGESFGSEDIWWAHTTLVAVNLFVPFFLRGPGIEPQVIRAPVQQIDLGATLLNAMGLGDVDFPGQDLLGDGRANSSPRFAISAFGTSASITQGSWHLELSLQDTTNAVNKRHYPQGHVRLVSLDDPEPRESKLDTEWNRATRMRAALIQWLGLAEDAQVAAAPVSLGAEAKSNLAALGYGSDVQEIDGSWWSPDGEANEWIERFEAD